ncbi:hypothetical protein GF325_14105 [Candidatus Bathyarchaeota archaeon]|nr:hypothetical protein [Candidatus Bathyarchaeota archaeon]
MDLILNNMVSVHQKETLGQDTGVVDKKREEVVVIITSIDPRINPFDIFKLEPGEACVIRNAGPTVSNDVIRSIYALLLHGKVKEIVILGHSNSMLSDVDTLRRNLSKLKQIFASSGTISKYFSSLKSAMDLFGFFTNEVTHLLDQVRELEIIKKVIPDARIIPLFYNMGNGHVYTGDELEEYREIIAENGDSNIDEIIPARYKAFKEEMVRVTNLEKRGPTVPGSGALGNTKGISPEIESPPEEEAITGHDMDVLNDEDYMFHESDFLSDFTEDEINTGESTEATQATSGKSQETGMSTPASNNPPPMKTFDEEMAEIRRMEENINKEMEEIANLGVNTGSNIEADDMVQDAKIELDSLGMDLDDSLKISIEDIDEEVAKKVQVKK